MSKANKLKKIEIERWQTIPILKGIEHLMSVESSLWLQLVKNHKSIRQVYDETLEMVKVAESDSIPEDVKTKRVEEINTDKVELKLYQFPSEEFSQLKMKGSVLMPLFDVVLN